MSTTVGVFSLDELRGLGWSRSDVVDACSAGRLERIGRGWFATPTASAWAVAAVQAGGRLGCLSGCRAYGLWTPMHSAPHVLLHRRAPAGSPGWHRAVGRLPTAALFPLEDCLAQVIRHHDAEAALIVLESATNAGKLSRSDADAMLAAAPTRRRGTLSFFDPRAESGSETRVRLWLQRHRFGVRPQVTIPTVGRVDLLVGRSLIIECDSATHHSYRAEDYLRDMAARALGYIVVRLSYAQVHQEWEATSIALLRQLRTGAHARAPHPH